MKIAEQSKKQVVILNDISLHSDYSSLSAIKNCFVTGVNFLFSITEYVLLTITEYVLLTIAEYVLLTITEYVLLTVTEYVLFTVNESDYLQ